MNLIIQKSKNLMQMNYIEILPALRMLMSGEKVGTLVLNKEVKDCSSKLTLGKDVTLEELEQRFAAYVNENGGAPELVDIEGEGCFAVGEEVTEGRLAGKVAVVTGGAQGFGGGIVDYLAEEGAHVVIADLNVEKGNEKVEEVTGRIKGANKVFFVEANVGSPESVQNLIEQTVKLFGGLDLFISNAGILRAGGLDEMTPETFELMTKVNYEGYFLCSKYASAVMKVQNKFRSSHFTDIIQINSKSGLKGSNKNFTYAGGKFGGIGLTQSFALELMPFNIKVNSICPGNFFDGPLWADPENGLFVQYLKAGKVPGAKTIEDVKKYYESQVPAGRGCTPLDVMRAIYYVVEQEYETGQAIPVTGGQEMLK
ncbi:SDR family NAD(P)-dependent oxidoreductase [Puteibacter caeruleilacunae]|nr:SDR family NAD(P)-dependent oxidoreductase [Puteibacter caeruleilacunae]